MRLLSSAQIKEMVGREAVRFVEDGMTLGVGTGSTAYWFIVALGERVQQGLHCRAVPTSQETADLLKTHEVPLISLEETADIDLTVDGADEIDPDLQLVKGGGGALLQEKMVAFASRRMIVVADETKLVARLGAYPLPVEVMPYGYRQVKEHIEDEYGIRVSLRKKDGGTYTTDHGHYILDCPFRQINDAGALHIFINNIPGVVDNGLFLNLADNALIGYADGSMKQL